MVECLQRRKEARNFLPTDIIGADLHGVGEGVPLSAGQGVGVLIKVVQKVTGTLLQLTLDLLPVLLVLWLENNAGCLQNILGKQTSI